MAPVSNPVRIHELRSLIPLNELTHDNLMDLSRKTEVNYLARGRRLFSKGDTVNRSFYILEGQIALTDDAGPERLIVGGTPQARYPIDHYQPRKSTATARTDVRYISIDNDLLDILLTWNQNDGYMVTEIEVTEEPAEEEEDDWMTQMLRTNIFHRIPAANIQAVFMRMEPAHFRAGDPVIRQGDEGDFYYHIRKGKCVVTHNSAKSGKIIKLAELGPGQGFGEESLIANTQRNANVTMLTDGLLMRLAKKDFVELLKAPVVKSVDWARAKQMVEAGEATWLDVRLESEHRNATIPGSLNLPFYLLRIKAGALDKDKTYITFCDTGGRSASAAYLLNERGIDAYCLQGGLMAVKELH